MPGFGNSGVGHDEDSFFPQLGAFITEHIQFAASENHFLVGNILETPDRVGHIKTLAESIDRDRIYWGGGRHLGESTWSGNLCNLE